MSKLLIHFFFFLHAKKAQKIGLTFSRAKNTQNRKMNVKFSKGPGAISKHKSEDIEKSMCRIKKTYIYFL